MRTQTLCLSSLQWLGMQLLNKCYWKITHCFYFCSCPNPQIWYCKICSHLVIYSMEMALKEPLIVTYIPDLNKASPFSYLTFPTIWTSLTVLPWGSLFTFPHWHHSFPVLHSPPLPHAPSSPLLQRLLALMFYHGCRWQPFPLQPHPLSQFCKLLAHTFQISPCSVSGLLTIMTV